MPMNKMYRIVHLKYHDLRDLLSDYQSMIPTGGMFWATRQEAAQDELLLVEVEVPRLGRVYSFECRVVANPRAMGLDVEPGYLLAFESKEDVTRQELLNAIGWQILGSNRRLHPRIERVLPVAWSDEGVGELHVAETSNISLGGAFIRTEVQPRENSLVNMHLRCGDEQEPMSVVARVAWTGGYNGVKGMGLQFLNLDPETMLKLRTVLEQDREDRF
ncbi:MAG: PilZ domain-containing protein [Deltaproteobacteria bacterium]|nr:PilZ domain-containing protein [Deltaproteobacteria bacterium]